MTKSLRIRAAYTGCLGRGKPAICSRRSGAGRGSSSPRREPWRMDSFEFNKIAGAVLATGLVRHGAQHHRGGGDLHPDEAREARLRHRGAEGRPPAAPAAPAGCRPSRSRCCWPTPTRRARARPRPRTASPATTFDKGGPNKVGPNLCGVVGRPAAHMEGFNYSAAMKAQGRQLDLRGSRTSS